MTQRRGARRGRRAQSRRRPGIVRELGRQFMLDWPWYTLLAIIGGLLAIPWLLA